jgi:hypothetical protein
VQYRCHHRFKNAGSAGLAINAGLAQQSPTVTLRQQKQRKSNEKSGHGFYMSPKQKEDHAAKTEEKQSLIARERRASGVGRFQFRQP